MGSRAASLGNYVGNFIFGALLTWGALVLVVLLGPIFLSIPNFLGIDITPANIFVVLGMTSVIAAFAVLLAIALIAGVTSFRLKPLNFYVFFGYLIFTLCELGYKILFWKNNPDQFADDLATMGASLSSDQTQITIPYMLGMFAAQIIFTIGFYYLLKPKAVAR